MNGAIRNIESDRRYQQYCSPCIGCNGCGGRSENSVPAERGKLVLVEVKNNVKVFERRPAQPAANVLVTTESLG